MEISKIREFNFISGLITGIVITAFLGIGILKPGLISSPEKTIGKHPAQIARPIQELSEKEKTEVLAYLRFKEIKESFIPTGIPEVYGSELNISFDQVQDAINKVAPLDPTYGQKKIILTGADLERYIKIGSQIACQYCCSATTLVFENGEAACGCEHSQMMRGLAAYLIKNHPEISNEQILEELKKWKITYFPKQTLTQELDRRQKVGEPGIRELLQEFPEFLPQMVGGC